MLSHCGRHSEELPSDTSMKTYCPAVRKNGLRCRTALPGSQPVPSTLLDVLYKRLVLSVLQMLCQGDSRSRALHAVGQGFPLASTSLSAPSFHNVAPQLLLHWHPTCSPPSPSQILREPNLPCPLTPIDIQFEPLTAPPPRPPPSLLLQMGIWRLWEWLTKFTPIGRTKAKSSVFQVSESLVFSHTSLPSPTCLIFLAWWREMCRQRDKLIHPSIATARKSHKKMHEIHVIHCICFK